MSLSPDTLLKSFQKKDQRALSRLISMAENCDFSVTDILAELFETKGYAHIIGITGPPGAGKSTLTSFLIQFIRKLGKTVAVIAVDPVSPFSGGALLGDRIRLSDHFNDEGVYIRSLSTRGKLGGLSLAMRQVVHLSSAFGFDYIIVETVGVGQSEIDIRKIADVTVLALVPEWGDAIQTLKAGILEIGDIFVVNKADREGAARLETELKNMLQMANREDAPVLTTTIKKEETVEKLFQEINRFIQMNQAKVQNRRSGSLKETLRELLLGIVSQEAEKWVDTKVKDEKNPYRFIANFRKTHPEGSLFKE